MPVLRVAEGPDKGAAFDLSDGESVLIGRYSTIKIQDKTVSRQHALLWQERGAWFIQHLGATNPTLLNGIVVAGQSPVNDGDRIELGMTRLVFWATDCTEPQDRMAAEEWRRAVDTQVAAAESDDTDLPPDAVEVDREQPAM